MRAKLLAAAAVPHFLAHDDRNPGPTRRFEIQADLPRIYNTRAVMYNTTWDRWPLGEAVRAAFLTVAVWWAVFSLPVLLFVEERRRELPPRRGGLVRSTFTDLAETFRHVRRYRQAFLFLIAYWFYIDGVDTIIRMAVDYGMSLGFAVNDLLTALLITRSIGRPIQQVISATEQVEDFFLKIDDLQLTAFTAGKIKNRYSGFTHLRSPPAGSPNRNISTQVRPYSNRDR